MGATPRVARDTLMPTPISASALTPDLGTPPFQPSNRYPCPPSFSLPEFVSRLTLSAEPPLTPPDLALISSCRMTLKALIVAFLPFTTSAYFLYGKMPRKPPLASKPKPVEKVNFMDDPWLSDRVESELDKAISSMTSQDYQNCFATEECGLFYASEAYSVDADLHYGYDSITVFDSEGSHTVPCDTLMDEGVVNACQYDASVRAPP